MRLSYSQDGKYKGHFVVCLFFNLGPSLKCEIFILVWKDQFWKKHCTGWCMSVFSIKSQERTMGRLQWLLKARDWI